MKIGVLALQGAFIEHEQMLAKLGVSSFEIRCLDDLKKPFDGLIIPGGESTVIGKLLFELGLFEPIKKLINDGLPTFGTCAGLLLLADSIENDTRKYFCSMNIEAVRNAYGRQLGSFVTDAEIAHVGTYRMNFIRAPYIDEILDPQVEMLAAVDGNIVAVRYKNQLALSFHPEVSEDAKVHAYFLDEIVQAV